MLAERDADDDAYLAELRKAMTDESPLGPREDERRTAVRRRERGQPSRASAAVADAATPDGIRATAQVRCLGCSRPERPLGKVTLSCWCC